MQTATLLGEKQLNIIFKIKNSKLTFLTLHGRRVTWPRMWDLLTQTAGQLPITSDQLHKRWYDEFNTNTKVLYETCPQVWPAYLATINKHEYSKERIKHIMEKECLAVVPNFRLRQHEPTTTAYPGIESESYVGIRSGKKRFITDLISLGIQGFTAFNTNRKVNQLKKGMKLFEQQHHLENNVALWP